MLQQLFYDKFSNQAYKDATQDEFETAFNKQYPVEATKDEDADAEETEPTTQGNSNDSSDIKEVKMYSLGGKEYMALGYVDALNSYGADIRTDFCVWLTKTKDGYKNGYVEFDE